MCDSLKINMHLSKLLWQEHPEYATLRSTLRHLVEKDGIGKLWAGISPRAFRIASAVVILQGVRSKLISLIAGPEAAAVVDASNGEALLPVPGD